MCSKIIILWNNSTHTDILVKVGLCKLEHLAVVLVQMSVTTADYVRNAAAICH
jgi:hypothetical protein